MSTPAAQAINPPIAESSVKVLRFWKNDAMRLWFEYWETSLNGAVVIVADCNPKDAELDSHLRLGIFPLLKRGLMILVWQTNLGKKAEYFRLLRQYLLLLLGIEEIEPERGLWKTKEIWKRPK
jgi:hypothetical protein